MNEYDEWVEFVVDLEKRNVKGGSYRQYEFKSVTPNVQSLHKKLRVRKLWWIMW